MKAEKVVLLPRMISERLWVFKRGRPRRSLSLLIKVPKIHMNGCSHLSPEEGGCIMLLTSVVSPASRFCSLSRYQALWEGKTSA